MALRIETEIRYAGYIAREQRVIREIQRHENVAIPADFDYAPLTTLTLEAREKLSRIGPAPWPRPGGFPASPPATSPAFPGPAQGKPLRPVRGSTGFLPAFLRPVFPAAAGYRLLPAFSPRSGDFFWFCL